MASKFVRNLPSLAARIVEPVTRAAVSRLEEAVIELTRMINSPASVNLFTSVLSGIVPASGGGTANYLRADGSWTAPPTGVPTTRVIATTPPLTGGGDLSIDRTHAITSFSGSTPGAVPTSPGGTGTFLRADGSWAAPVAVAVWTATTLALGSTAKTEHYITVTDASISPTSKVAVVWGATLDTDVNGPDIDTVTFSARPGSGSAVVVVGAETPVSGNLKVIYQVA